MKIVKIPLSRLKYMKSQNFTELTPYIHKNPLVKWLFWKRLKTALNFAKDINAKKVLDFGSGSGIFLPTLSKNFPEVYSVDLDIRSLEYVKKVYNLENVKIAKGNENNKLPYEDNFFDVIFAADVLEHFKDSYEIQKEFKRVLKKGGYLIISGPTENFLYELSRKFLYKRKKPDDHYTDVYDVMKKTSKLFRIEKIKTLPCAIIPGFKIYKSKKLINLNEKRE